MNPAVTSGTRTAPLERGSLEMAKKAKPFRIFDFLWRRGPLILGLGVPAFLVLNILAAPFIHPIYKVEGTLLIKQSKEPTITGPAREAIQGDIGVFQRTLVLRILDPSVLTSALDCLEDSQRPDFLKGLGSGDRAVYSLMKNLVAKEVERTYLIRVTLEAGSAEGLAPTLNAVLKSLTDELQHEQEEQFASRLNYLLSEKTKIANRSAEEKGHILALANRFEDRSFLRSTYTTDLGKTDLLQKLYWDARADYLKKAALLDQAKNDREKLGKMSLMPFAESVVFNNFGINQITQWTYGKSQELRAQIDGLTTQNPDRKYVEARMNAMNEYMESYKKSVADATIHNLTEKRAFELDAEVIKAQDAADSSKKTAESLDESLKATCIEAARTSEGIFDASELTFGLTQLRDRLASINTRIDDVELEAKSPLPVVIDQKPTMPAKPASSNASKLRILILLASFGFVGGICLLFDFLDGRIRVPEELGAAIGGPGADPIPALADKEVPEFANVLQDHPRHPATLALRNLALRLVLEHQRCGAKIFAFVGSHPRSGNSTIALNIARAVSSHGFKVLLAELPTPSPGLGVAAALPAGTPPLSPWGNKEADPRSAVEIIPWAGGGSEDRVRSSFDAFLANAAKAYDAVVLDLVGFDRSDIAHEAAVKSDVVVVTARQNQSLFSEVKQIVDSAVVCGVPAITTVLNFCEPDQFRMRVLSYLATAQKSISVMHIKYSGEAANAARTAFAKVGKIPVWKKLAGLPAAVKKRLWKPKPAGEKTDETK